MWVIPTRTRSCFKGGALPQGGCSATEAALRAELAGLKIKELRARAAKAGATEDEIEDAIEAADTRGTLVELIVGGFMAGRWRGC